MSKPENQAGGTPDRDCRACGACCIAPPSNCGWAEFDDKEIDQLPSRIKRRLIIPPDTLFAATPYMIPTVQRGGHNVCVFLRGTPGKRVSCSIYEHRPEVCRGFPYAKNRRTWKTWNPQCEEVRQRFQVEV